MTVDRTTAARRLAVLLVAFVVLAAAGTWAVLDAAERAGRRDREQPGGPAVHPGPLALGPAAGGPRLLFRSMAWGPHRDEIAGVPADRPDGPRTVSGLKCLRFHAASGTGICLRAEHGPLVDTYRAVILDADLHERRSFPAAGIPTRARVSPSGRMVAWTVFVSGDSYAGAEFSTWTTIVDTHTWTVQENLESFAVTRNGRPYRAPDLNIWGVTFADDNRFYATVATDGHTWLAAGDVAAHTLTTLHQNVECPSLSPDGTRIAYKKRAPEAPDDAPWRLYVLDLRTMTESATAERRNVDDQALWIDAATLLYALPGDYGADLWTVPADGTGAPRMLAASALAPALVG
ncbi:TolB-like translocation protein [Embleya sp. NPDC055664]